ELGFSDMEILKNLTPDYLLTKLDIINKAKCVVMDTNIPECVQFLEKKCKVPLFMDTVSAKKTEAVKNILGRIFFIKPNLLEAEILSGVTYRTFGDLDLIAKKIHAKDIKRICISMGAEGVYFSDGNIRGIVPAIPTKVVNTTGAGDAFCAATVWAYLNGRGIKECTIVGCRAASLTILSEDTVSKEMCADKLIEAL
ncbi:MAG: PfkB family carbohydrate kinase, partial [Clostridia bacterium]